MANYYEDGRTNYFKVKDRDAFTAWVDRLAGSPDISEGDNGTLCLLFDPESGVPTFRTEGDYEDVEIDFLNELSEHLVPGEVAVVMASGSEKLRYVTGYAAAVNAYGETRSIDLREIYDKAEELMDDDDPRTGVSRAEW